MERKLTLSNNYVTMMMEELALPHSSYQRNSVSSIFGLALNHGRSAGRASVPTISAADRERLRQGSNAYKAASNLQTSQSLKSRFKKYQYIRSSSNNSTESIEQSGILSKLDETFAQIKSQLNNLSEENRTVRTRVHSLTEAVSELCSHFSTRNSEDEDDEEIDGEDNLSLSLPSNGIQRMHSVPPFSTGWRDLEVFDEDLMDTNTLSNDWERISWVKSLERSGETNLIGLHNARVPCIIMVDDCNDSTSEEENGEQEINGGNDRHEDTGATENECDRTNEEDYKYGGFDIDT
uniref:Uncharacterized protein n=1 Tax=Amphimedon queenslandica TaxID=400682 RepID=A0A1X7VVJ6_AMPQE